MSQFYVSGGGGSGPGPVFPNNFPITPFVVGPVGQAGYQTVQAGANAVGAAGGGLLCIQKGSYTENVVWPENIVVWGEGYYNTEIVGTHTPPAGNDIQFANIRFSASHFIFDSASAGTADMEFDFCRFSIFADGISLNMTNWQGDLTVKNCFCDQLSDDGFINGGFGAVLLQDSSIGSFSDNTQIMNIGSNTFTATNCTFHTPILADINIVMNNCITNFTLQLNDLFNLNYHIFNRTVTSADGDSGSFSKCQFNTGTTPAYVMNIDGSGIKMSDCLINTSASPCITGSGSTPIEITNMSFVNSFTLDPSLTYVFGTNTTGNLNTDGGRSIKVTTVTNAIQPYNVLRTDEFISCDSVGGLINVNLPATPVTGTVIEVCDSTGNAAVNTIIINGGANSISYQGSLGSSVFLTVPFQLVTLYFNGTFWNAV